MAITFPVDPAAQTPTNTFSPTSTPVANTANGNTYYWNGTAWTSTQVAQEQYVNVVGDTMTGTLVVPTLDATTVEAGNIILPDDGGITFGTSFGAAGGGGSSKVLDDYEEGIWQPKFFNDQNGATTVSTGNRAAKYVKIGRTVYISCYIQCTSKGTNTGNVTVDHLPYASDANGQLHCGIAVGFFSGLTSNHSTLYATVQPNSNTILIRKVAGTADISVSSVVASDITNGFDLVIGGSYITAD